MTEATSRPTTESSFETFFKKATSNKPYGYQKRLADGFHTTGCHPQVIDVPTGLGKTAAAITAWLWNRIQHPDASHRDSWPRRLVYCLPMRTLVEQTLQETTKWIENGFPDTAQRPKVHLLMGAEDDGDWDIHPERNAIIIGTQDMLLSRALNRGYGMSRFRWPMHFGLLNNDCLWIFDEVQLMGNGLATGIQLDGFRSKLWPTAKPCVTWWMSATTSKDAFTTTDRTDLNAPAPPSFTLTKEERQSDEIAPRLNAEKKIEVLPKVPKAADVLQWHQKGRLTLLVANTVRSAKRWYDELQPHPGKPQKKVKAEATPELLLIHSRYRRGDRATQMQRLYAFIKLLGATGAADNHPGMIVIATQVIEAGIDISSATLCSEIAPWASVIQRLGRLNRDGKQPHAIAKFWKPTKDDENGAEAPNAGRIGPYETVDINQAHNLLSEIVKIQNQGTAYRQALDHVLAQEASAEALKLEPTAVIRADDVFGLFSTEPDLAGGFTDISPFVRNIDLNCDVAVYWRPFQNQPSKEIARPTRDELVNVPAFTFSKFLADSKQSAFQWDEDAERWTGVRGKSIISGMTLLLPVSTGGYSSTTGWTGEPQDKPSPLPVPETPPASLFDDSASQTGWQSIDEHTSAVTDMAEHLAKSLSLSKAWQESLISAGHWHDAGKAHPRWQNALPAHPDNRPGPWGKFEGQFVSRITFRHEALSLLAAWTLQPVGIAQPTKLTLYLIATHHGKVRTILQSSGNDDFFGWHETDEPLTSQNGSQIPIDLSVRNFFGAGEVNWKNRTLIPTRPSWTNIIDELLGPAWVGDGVTQIAIPSNEPRELGPFQIAFIETVFRAADARASKGEKP
jgi:CRISPR-associated endonuclease/helicase Cas3